MRKIFFLSTCSTCSRIIKELNLTSEKFSFQDIKKDKITPKQLDELKAMCGSYEALFSRTAMKYRALKLNEKALTEKDYRDFILKEYTFLKRPVISIDKHIFIGSSKKVIDAVKSVL